MTQRRTKLLSTTAALRLAAVGIVGAAATPAAAAMLPAAQPNTASAIRTVACGPCAPKNPCAAKAANPCAAKTANPCAAKTPSNPCAAENPCAPKK